ncbi:magnesium and cobalt transport protein CorA [Patulibacter sp.]|uniref:magnesium and cobalt transport protein CorA n=1 Tax=Patulibacter sp. TaxID=1912859 RepID=UPI0027188577|nr:magnesium and cobalt transport protein CorA [Patulibacter sp.]MDO9408165.1 magnesium and cobalt transport protein CorA [Patulibacter sp.]
MIVGRAIYRDGRRLDTPEDLAELFACCRLPDTVVWLGLHEPTAEEFAEVAHEFDLHELAVEDAILAHQRPKLEQYGTTRFLVLRSARYVDETETVEFGEVHLFVGPGFVVVVRHGDASQLKGVRDALEGRPDLLRLGEMAIMHAIVDRIVDDYAPVVAGIENDVDEIEDDVFDGSPAASRRIYELTREVIEFQRAVQALPDMLGRLMAHDAVGEEERRYLRDVQDHALRVREQAAGFRELLQNILNVNLTLETKALSEASIAQNEEVKKISAWAAILFAPTLVGTIYGMNFKNMPELNWQLGYPMAIVMMLAVGCVLFGVFKWRRWI